MSSVSRAISSCARAADASSVRMLWRRSASLMRMTRMSRAIAMTILRKFSACFSSRLEKVILASLVTPSTRVAISAAEQFAHLVERGQRVLDHVVQQAGDDRGTSSLSSAMMQRDVERMDDVGLARLALLPGVHARRELVGAADQLACRPADCTPRSAAGVLRVPRARWRRRLVLPRREILAQPSPPSAAPPPPRPLDEPSESSRSALIIR